MREQKNVSSHYRSFRKSYRALIPRPSCPEDLPDKVYGAETPVNIRCTTGGQLQLSLGGGKLVRQVHPEFKLTPAQVAQLYTEGKLILAPPTGWEQFALQKKLLLDKCIAAARASYVQQGWRYGGPQKLRHRFWRGRVADIKTLTVNRQQMIDAGFALLYPNKP